MFPQTNVYGRKRTKKSFISGLIHRCSGRGASISQSLWYQHHSQFLESHIISAIVDYSNDLAINVFQSLPQGQFYQATPAGVIPAYYPPNALPAATAAFAPGTAPTAFPDNAAAAAALFGSTAAAVQQPFKHMGGAGGATGGGGIGGGAMGRGGYKSTRRGRGGGMVDRSSDSRSFFLTLIFLISCQFKKSIMI